MVTRMILAVLALALAGGCADSPKAAKTRWDAYYAVPEPVRPHVEVVPPQGTTVPMSKLIAEYVRKDLAGRKVSVAVGSGQISTGGSKTGDNHYILTGQAESPGEGASGRYVMVMRWLLSDSTGRVISSYSHGVEGTAEEWDYGSARLLLAVAGETGGAVAEIVGRESRALQSIDPLRQGLLLGDISGVSEDDARLLAEGVKTGLRASDIFVTGDMRQAVFRLDAQIDTQEAPDGQVDIKISWIVSSLNQVEIGRAVQENRIAAKEIASGWGGLASRVGQAAAVGIEHVFGLRAGPPPGSPDAPQGEPPTITLPGEPGRAPPPPR